MSWQTRIPGSVPIVCHRMHRVFWVPKRYVSVVAVAMQGSFTIRELAARTGYSVHGAHAALASLTEMAIGRVVSSRGCRGRTRFMVSSDASANVPSTERGEHSKGPSERRVVQGTFHGITPVADGIGAWRRLRDALSANTGTIDARAMMDAAVLG